MQRDLRISAWRQRGLSSVTRCECISIEAKIESVPLHLRYSRNCQMNHGHYMMENETGAPTDNNVIK